MSASTHAPSRRELTDGLDHGTLVVAGVATLGLIMAVLVRRSSTSHSTRSPGT
jgi:hypothetical protein